ncbi:glycosyltransferase [Paenibacillus sp. NPDC057934]|uniref:glycosyltransferase n=1 Tax=Paenibacillus sp. NPDC057934 TaxID=3346282 RepID=UPI0036D8DEBD
MNITLDSQIKRVLFANGVPVDVGGIEKSIMDIYRGIDRKNLLIDFVVRKPQSGYYHKEIELYNGRIFNIFDRTKHKGNRKWNIYSDIYSFFEFYRILKKRGPYSAVHIVHPNLDGYLIAAAKLAGVPIRIIHSHNTGFDDRKAPNFMRILIRKASLSLGKLLATHIWGCSRAACEHMFGKEIMKDTRAEVVQNPVDIRKFRDNTLERVSAREQFKIPNNKIVILNVARYAPQKNHKFLVDILEEATKIRKDIHLMMIGTGPLEDVVKDYVEEKNVGNFVTMLDKNTSVPLALKASDFFVLPSIYEGFGNTLIEAQAANVPCFASTACQPEPNLGLVDYLPLNKGPKYWAEVILSNIERNDKKKVDEDRLFSYDLSTVSSHMENVYLKGSKYFEG